MIMPKVPMVNAIANMYRNENAWRDMTQRASPKNNLLEQILHIRTPINVVANGRKNGIFSPTENNKSAEKRSCKDNMPYMN
jgi:hypothetical protein